MEWLRENWFWIAVVVFFVWMHTKMHGGHGGHGSHGGWGCGGGGHRHGGDDERTERKQEDEHAGH